MGAVGILDEGALPLKSCKFTALALDHSVIWRQRYAIRSDIAGWLGLLGQQGRNIDAVSDMVCRSSTQPWYILTTFITP